MNRDTALKLLNVASCLEHGMDAKACASELRLIVDSAALQPDTPPLTSLTVRYDLSPAATESALRSKLIELGWTPPVTTDQQGEVQK